jgi:GNAT superfamily N-acetyltransferase
MIRDATIEDVPRLVEMGQQFIAESEYAVHIRTNVQQLSALATQLITSEDGAVLVADRDGMLVGMIGLIAFANHISGDRTVGEVFFWVDPEHRGSTGVRLMKATERWARQQGAVAWQMIAPNERVGRMYAAQGFVPLETTWQRSLM